MNCITIQHCIVRQWAGEEAVSRYNYCIVTEAKRGRWALGVGWEGAGRAGHRRSAQAGVRGRSGLAGSWAAGAHGRAWGARGRAWGARGRARATGRGWALHAGGKARQGGQARELGARAGLWVCTRCTRPVFGPIRLGIFFLSQFLNIVREPGS